MLGHTMSTVISPNALQLPCRAHNDAIAKGARKRLHTFSVVKAGRMESMSTIESGPIFDRTEEEKELDMSIVQIFRRLFPELRPRNLVDPARSSIMAAISNMGTYAFGAYDNPSIEAGFVEQTTQENSITHLKWDWVSSAMEGILKITAQEANDLRDSDLFFKGHSDPYCVFTTGGSIVKTETQYDKGNPKWNSTHYLCVRKRRLEPEADACLTVSVFDKDVRSGIGAIANWVDRDDYLGSCDIALSKIREPGVHEMEVKLQNPRRRQRTPSTVKFSVEFKTVADALKEMDMDVSSEKWLERNPDVAKETNWPEIATMIADIGFIDVEKVAFIDAKETDTQAWVHVNTAAKVVVVSFRGSQEPKDFLTDARFFRSSLAETMRSDGFVMRPTDKFMNRDVRVHRGFRGAYESIRESVFRVCYDLTGWDPAWTICITGHSLGGALATLCAFEMANKKIVPQASVFRLMFAYLGMMSRQPAGTSPKVGVMNFGAPRVGNAKFAELYNETVRESLRVVNAEDLIQRLPLSLPPIFYSHTKHKILLRPNGEIDISDMVVQSGDVDEVENLLEEEEIDDQSLLERAFAKFDEHLGTYYFSLVEKAVEWFSKKERVVRENLEKPGERKEAGSC